MIAVTGATGQLGRFVIDALLKKVRREKLLPPSVRLPKRPISQRWASLSARPIMASQRRWRPLLQAWISCY